MSAESDLRQVIARIEAAWRNRQFDGLDQCFHEEARILGPDF